MSRLTELSPGQVYIITGNHADGVKYTSDVTKGSAKVSGPLSAGDKLVFEKMEKHELADKFKRDGSPMFVMRYWFYTLQAERVWFTNKQIRRRLRLERAQ